MHLDLENPVAFREVLRSNQQVYASALRLCRDNNHLVSAVSAFADLPNILNDALHQFVDYAKCRIDCVTAYHGCRVFDESSYRFYGIKRLQTKEQILWCKSFFGEETRIDQIVSDLGIDYIRHGESGVFCIKSIEAARKNHCHHQEGSEFVRHIAKRLGSHAESKYFSKGSSCFVEVCTPRQWFDHNSRVSIDILLRDVFSHWLWNEVCADWPGDPRAGGIVFDADIPSGYVKTFHYFE